MPLSKIRTIAAEAAARLAPLAFLFWFYRYALRTWFQQDDFAWLQLRGSLHSASDWVRGLLTPMAQGTIRPVSERLFFIWGSEYFFLNPLPMHWLVALTQSLNVLLLFGLVARLTESRVAAMLASFAWLCSAGIATPMSWLSTYNQILISFVFLAGLRSFIAAAETGRRRWMAACWALFLTGFGVLEINVVFPALLTGWAVLYRPAVWRKTLAMWLVSLLYAAVHVLWASKGAEGVYARHWDLSIVWTYLRYWGAALAGAQIPPHWQWPAEGRLWAICGIVAGWAGVFWARRKSPAARAALYGALWFTAVLGPVLPLRDHFSDYYLASAYPGVAIILACFTLQAWGMGPSGRVAAGLVLITHLGMNMALNEAVTQWRYARGQRMKVLVEGLERAVELHSGKTIFVSGLDRDLFWSCFYDRPYILFGAPRVYLMPGEEQAVSEVPEFGSVARYVAPKLLVARALDAGTGVVYRFEERFLRNVTRSAAHELPVEWRQGRPAEMDLGQPEWSKELLDGWHPVEPNGLRWMKQTASLVLGAPGRGEARLFIEGYCPEQPGGDPPVLTVAVGSDFTGQIRADGQRGVLSGELALPSGALQGQEAVVRLSMSRRLRVPGDVRELGAAFGRIGFRAVEPAGR